MGVTYRGPAMEMLFWSFSSKEMIRFHPNLVGIIFEGRRPKVVKMVQVAPGGGPLRVKLCKFHTILPQISRSRTDLVYSV